MNHESRERLLFGVVLLAGAALLLWQYLGRASLWLDELAVALNILSRSLTALLGRPLADGQVAPPGFLLASKFATAIFGGGELALRLFPLLCALGSLPLFALLAKRLLSGRAALLATILFSLGTPFVRYGAEAKPYSADVAAALALMLAANALLEDEANAARRAWAGGLVGVVTLFFSNGAVLVMAGLAVALVAGSLLRGRQPGGPLLLLLGLWAGEAAAAVAWAHHMTTKDARVFLRHYWSNGFPLINWRHRFGARFLLARVEDFWGIAGMQYRLPFVWAALTALGVGVLWWRRRSSALILVGPIAAAFGVAVLDLYPFRGRLILFLGPSFILAAAAGAWGLVELGARIRVPRLASAGLIALPAVLAVATHLPVYSHEEPRLLIEALARRRLPGDPVYVYYDAVPAMRYYAPRAGIDPAGVVDGDCHRGDLSAYLLELDRFRGRSRLWVLIVHHQKLLKEQATIRSYLGEIGRRLDGVTAPEYDGVSTLDLYDLSDPGRLASSSAEKFPLTEIDVALAARIGCGHGPH